MRSLFQSCRFATRSEDRWCFWRRLRLSCSHSLLASLALAVGGALAYWVVTRYRAGAWLVGLCVLSHWVLDFISHRPDLPLAPGISARVGFGLWNSVPATLTVEILLFAGGVWLYTRTTQPNVKRGRWSLRILIGFLLAIYLGNAFGPPPPSARAIAWVGVASWLLPFWAAWVDRRRVAARHDAIIL